MQAGMYSCRISAHGKIQNGNDVGKEIRYSYFKKTDVVSLLKIYYSL